MLEKRQTFSPIIGLRLTIAEQLTLHFHCGSVAEIPLIMCCASSGVDGGRTRHRSF